MAASATRPHSLALRGLVALSWALFVLVSLLLDVSGGRIYVVDIIGAAGCAVALGWVLFRSEWWRRLVLTASILLIVWFSMRWLVFVERLSMK